MSFARAGGLGVVERPLVDGEDRLPRLRLGLGAQLHALGEDDLLLRGEERHAADLPQVEADGVVRVEDLGGDGLGLGVRLLGDGRRRAGARRRAPRRRAPRPRARRRSGSSSMAAAASSASVSEAGEEGSKEITMLQLHGAAPDRATQWECLTSRPIRGPGRRMPGPRLPTYVVACQATRHWPRSLGHWRALDNPPTSYHPGVSRCALRTR